MLSQIIVAYCAFLTTTMHIDVVNKHDSAAMERFGALLQSAGVVRDDAFMNQYATTIGETIFVPFVPGVPSGRWTLEGQITVLAHEARHVEQTRRMGQAVMAVQYFTSAGRVLIEGEAYSVQMLVARELCLDAWDMDAASRVMDGYAIRPSDQLAFESYLLSRSATLRVRRALAVEAEWSQSLAALFRIANEAGLNACQTS